MISSFTRTQEFLTHMNVTLLIPPSIVFSCMILQFASILPWLEVDFGSAHQIEEETTIYGWLLSCFHPHETIDHLVKSIWSMGYFPQLTLLILDPMMFPSSSKPCNCHVFLCCFGLNWFGSGNGV